jgi:hypothetical protein
MDLAELRDLLDYLENQGVDEDTLRRVFDRYCPRAASATEPGKTDTPQVDDGHQQVDPSAPHTIHKAK